MARPPYKKAFQIKDSSALFGLRHCLNYLTQDGASFGHNQQKSPNKTPYNIFFVHLIT